jgi:N-acyl amino acid synthase of PEP-CTERM/exosortase system
MDFHRTISSVALTETNLEETLLDRFNREYECRLADDPASIQRAFEARYQVYCVENSFEHSSEDCGGLETDEFDSHSRHSVLIHRPTGETIGTVRLILPIDGQLDSFSMRCIVSMCKDNMPFLPGSVAEVSRFSISKLRRQGTLGNPSSDRTLHDMAAAMRRSEPLLSLGLIQGLVRMSALHRITHWCAIMEPKMLRMLAAMGIYFKPVGNLLEYHGLRQICYCEIAEILRTVKLKRPTFWEVITDGGSLGTLSHN